MNQSPSTIMRIPYALRERFFQPLADAASAQIGIGCFTLAGWCLITCVAFDVVHVLDAPTSILTVAGPLAWVLIVRVSLNLFRFERRCPHDLPVVVHPNYRQDGHLLVATACALGSLIQPFLSSGEGATDMACLTLSAVSGALGMFLASCEWRRRPPSRTHVPAPSGA